MKQLFIFFSTLTFHYRLVCLYSRFFHSENIFGPEPVISRARCRVFIFYRAVFCCPRHVESRWIINTMLAPKKTNRKWCFCNSIHFFCSSFFLSFLSSFRPFLALKSMSNRSLAFFVSFFSSWFPCGRDKLIRYGSEWNTPCRNISGSSKSPPVQGKSAPSFFYFCQVRKFDFAACDSFSENCVISITAESHKFCIFKWRWNRKSVIENERLKGFAINAEVSE